MEVLEWLQNWYAWNCDGDWEDLYGVEIKRLDNLGWSVEIDLFYTVVEDKVFETIKYKNGGRDWMHCYVKEAKFQGSGDAKKLKKILEIFKNWVEE